MNNTARPAVFLDRDGVINHDHGYVHTIERFEFLPGAVEGMRKLADAGFLLVVITNQSGIGRGLYTDHQFHSLMDHVRTTLATLGIDLAGIYHCPHAPPRDGEPSCDCRKPAPGLILSAASDLGLDLTRSILIGDRESDIAAGRAAGVRKSFLIGHEQPGGSADAVFADLIVCADHIVATQGLPPPS